DDGLTKLPDLSENRKVGIDPEMGPALARSQREAQSRPDSATQSAVVGLGSHSRPPGVAVSFLDRDGVIERATHGPDLDLEAAPVGAAIHRLDGFDTGHAARDPRQLPRVIPHMR